MVGKDKRVMKGQWSVVEERTGKRGGHGSRRLMMTKEENIGIYVGVPRLPTIK